MPPRRAKKTASIVDEAITNVSTRSRMAPRLARTTKSLPKSPKKPTTTSKTVRFGISDSPTGIRKSKRLAEKASTKSAPTKLAPAKPPKKQKVKTDVSVLPKSADVPAPAKKIENSKKKSSKIAPVQAKTRAVGPLAPMIKEPSVKKNASVAPKLTKVAAPTKKAETSKKSTKSSTKRAPSKVKSEEIRLLTPVVKEPSVKVLVSPKPTKLPTADKPKAKASKKKLKSAPIQDSPVWSSRSTVSILNQPIKFDYTIHSWPLITTEADLRFPISAEIPSFGTTAPARIFLRAAIDSMVVDLLTCAERVRPPKGRLHTTSSIRQMLADDEEFSHLFGSLISLPLPSNLPSEVIRVDDTVAAPDRQPVV
uniref:CBFD_NFYB_HMF domain-containing protein n=1 Tax=Panagrellus redivivus TaxID=6233 RepID=A0A7E4UL44_PANRE